MHDLKITLTQKYPFWFFLLLTFATVFTIYAAIAGDISPLWIFVPFGSIANGSALIMWLAFLVKAVD